MKLGGAALLAALAFWGLLFWTSGLFSSWFHLVDEHALAQMAADLGMPGSKLTDVIRKWAAMDLAERRFRPLYYPSRVLRAGIFGLSWPAWSSYNAVLAAATGASLFVFGRLIGLTAILSFALAAWSTLGRPSSIWWRLGTPETEGNLLLVLALLCIARAVVKPDTRRRSEFFAFLLAGLASLTKEGMILYLPAIAAFRVWLPCWLRQETFKSALNDARPLVIALGLMAGVEILALALAVGTAGTGYAGVDAASFGLARLGASFKAADRVLALWIPAAATALALIAAAFSSRRPCCAHATPLIAGWLVFLIAAVPQILLYAKSGWADHYYNPLVISGALLTMISINGLRSVHRWVYLIFAVLVLLQIHPRFTWTKQQAREYAEDGITLRRLLDAAEDCTHQNEPLLLVANARVHYEEAFSLRAYLTLTRNRHPVYLATVGGAGMQIPSGALAQREEVRSFLNPVTLEDHYFQGKTLARMTPDQRERLTAILILSPESLQPAFLAAASGWLRPECYRQTDFDVAGLRARLLCRNP